MDIGPFPYKDRVSPSTTRIDPSPRWTPWIVGEHDASSSFGIPSALVLRQGEEATVRASREVPASAAIVVGVDVPAPSPGSLLYAAQQAASCQVELVVVRAWQPGPGRRVDLEAGVLAEALAICRAAAPGVSVTGRLLQGDAAEVLVREALDAQLLVLGLQNGSPRSGSVLGPVARDILQRATCPVALAWLPERVGRPDADVLLAR